MSNNIQIYNSLIGKKEKLKTIKKNEISMYLCGLTVYDHSHIGHARTNIVFDMIVKYFRHQGFKVNFVRNITDIDDKIILRAKEQNISTEKLVDKFIKSMYEDFDSLGIDRPDFEPKATESIVEIIDFIKTLIEKDYAYMVENGDVYFRVEKFKEYGKLSGQKISDLKSGVRIETSDIKENQIDFVLWKSLKTNEPSWNSPWSDGRPGWHIECSAMAKKILGANFDIHAGGGDLKFPHHENEIAQSEACNNSKFANIWMHSGMVNINKEKMSKSLNNFFSIKDVLKSYNPEIIRFFLLTAHYRSVLDYSKDNLDNAKVGLMRLYKSIQNCEISDIYINELKDDLYVKNFHKKMDNDFNTPEAFSVLFQIAKNINVCNIENDKKRANELASILIYLSNVLGILTGNISDFDIVSNDEEINKIEELILKRSKLKSNKDWLNADIIRDELLLMNVVIEDTINGTVWKKK